MKYNFPRRSHLVTEAQFKKVCKARQKISSEIFAIYYCYNNTNHPRLGVIVPKKKVKSAVKRNCFKRIIREEFRLKQKQLKNIDIVVVVIGKAGDLSKKEINLLLEKQISKLSV